MAAPPAVLVGYITLFASGYPRPIGRIKDATLSRLKGVEDISAPVGSFVKLHCEMRSWIRMIMYAVDRLEPAPVNAYCLVHMPYSLVSG